MSSLIKPYRVSLIPWTSFPANMTRSPYRDGLNAQTLPDISTSLSFAASTSATFSSFAVYSFLHRCSVACKIAADGMNVMAEPRMQKSNRGGHRSQDVMFRLQLHPAPLVLSSLDRENHSSSSLSSSHLTPASQCTTSLCFQFWELDIAHPTSSSLRPAAPSCFR